LACDGGARAGTKGGREPLLRGGSRSGSDSDVRCGKHLELLDDLLTTYGFVSFQDDAVAFGPLLRALLLTLLTAGWPAVLEEAIGIRPPNAITSPAWEFAIRRPVGHVVFRPPVIGAHHAFLVTASHPNAIWVCGGARLTVRRRVAELRRRLLRFVLGASILVGEAAYVLHDAAVMALAKLPREASVDAFRAVGRFQGRRRGGG